MQAVALILSSRGAIDTDAQLEAIHKFCTEHGLDCIPFQVWSTEGNTGTHRKPRITELVAFMEDSGATVLIAESIDKTIDDPEQWDELYTEFAKRGWRIVFIRDTDLNEILDAVASRLDELRKLGDTRVSKLALEMARESLRHYVRLYWRTVVRTRRRLKRVIERAKAEGKVYTKPSLVTWYALYLSGKERLNELTRRDIERAEMALYEKYAKLYIEGYPITALLRRFLVEERGFIEWMKQRLGKPKSGDRKPNTYLSYMCFRNNIKRLLSKHD